MQQRANRMRHKSGTSEVSIAFYNRVHELAGIDPDDPQPGAASVEVDVQKFAKLLQAAVDRCVEAMIGNDLSD